MKPDVQSVVLFVISSLLAPGCWKSPPTRKATYPVTGQVFVDGKPAAQLQVYCRDPSGMDAEHPTVSSAFTNEMGQFDMSTYVSGDGVPEGEYFLSFEWRDYSPFTGSYDGPDKLDGRYANQENPQYRIRVVKGKSKDVGRIDLHTE